MYKKKVCVILPCYRVKHKIYTVYKKLIKTKIDCLIFVDDKCPQNSVKYLKSKTKINKKVQFIFLKKNLGVGGATLKGFKSAHNQGFDLLIKFDADNQHRITDIQYFEKYLKKNISCDVVIGSRLLKTKKITSTRTFGIYFFNFFFFLITGKKISDCSSGIKCFRAKILKGLNLSQNQYHTPEFLLECLKMDLLIKRSLR